MGEGRGTWVLVEKPVGKNNIEGLGVDGGVILKWIFKN
jgi:hypothetical protein